MSVERGEVEQMIEAARVQISTELARALSGLEALLRDELHEELVEITRRIDGVHTGAIRALTASIKRRK